MKVLLAAPLLLVGLAVGAMPAKADPGDCTFAVHEIPEEVIAFSSCVRAGQPVCILVPLGPIVCNPACIDFDAVHGGKLGTTWPDLTGRDEAIRWSFAGVGNENFDPLGEQNSGYYDVAIARAFASTEYCTDTEH